MSIIEPADKDVKTFKGLHVYHGGKSNCAGRVRVLIEEKGLPWTSHYIDIPKKENITPEYFAINPKGLVPTIILDGEVVIESNDILLYLEERFPAPRFLPNNAAEKDEVRTWLKRSADIHVPGIKTYNYKNFVVSTMQRSEEESRLYKSLQKDPELLAFHDKHEDGKTFPKEEVDKALALLMTAIGDMDAAVARGGWLVGDSYSLADISWAPSVNAFIAFGLPVLEHKHLADWFARIQTRPGWQRGWTLWADGPRPAGRVVKMAQ